LQLAKSSKQFFSRGAPGKTDPSWICAQGLEGHGDVRGFASWRSMYLGDTIDAAKTKFVQHEPGVDGRIQADTEERVGIATRISGSLTHSQDIFPTRA
jgi:hypothetical protein